MPNPVAAASQAVNYKIILRLAAVSLSLPHRAVTVRCVVRVGEQQRRVGFVERSQPILKHEGCELIRGVSGQVLLQGVIAFHKRQTTYN